MKKSIYLEIKHMLSITGHTSTLMVHMILLKYLIILVSLSGLSGYLVCPYQIHSGSQSMKLACINLSFLSLESTSIESVLFCICGPVVGIHIIV